MDTKSDNRLNIAIAVPIFPNLVQTYVLSQLDKFNRSDVKLSIIASIEQHYDVLPDIVNRNRLTDIVTYIKPGMRSVLRSLLALLTRPAYWRQVIKILSSKMDKAHERGYRIKCLLRAGCLDIDALDIVHSHSFFSSYHLLFLKTVFGIPIAATYHGQVPQGIVRLTTERQQMVLDTCDLFFVNTRFAERELQSLGCDPQKIHILPQGTTLSDFPYTANNIDEDRTINLLTVGRLSPEKGQHVAIDALKELAADFPGIRYHVVGHGPCAGSLQQQVADAGLDQNVVFHGFTSNEDLLQIYRDAHIFILPSIDTGDGYHVETQGVVLQEAQASGVAVIGSKTGGIPEVIIDGETGLLFDEADSAQLADCIRSLIEQPERYQLMLQTALQDMKQRFDIDVIGDKQLDSYRQLIAGRRTS